MLNVFLENIYLTPIIGVITGWIVVYLYNKIEHKNYTKGDYFKFGLVIYLTCLFVIYVARNLGSHDKILNLSNPNELLATLPAIGLLGSNVATIMNDHELIPEDITSETFSIGHPNF